MKKYLTVIIILFFLGYGVFYAFYYKGFYIDFQPDCPVNAQFRTEGDMIQLQNQNGTFSDFFIRGVDVSSSMPGNYATYFAPEEEDYLRWLKYIGEMGANTIRVYTIMDDDFYNALYTYNTTQREPLYLLQGILVSDEANTHAEDAFSEEFFGSLMKDGITAVDIIHGKRVVLNHKSHGSGTYLRDISPWVLGYLVGQQWDAGTVAYTNHKEADDNLWKGKYFEASKDATEFEEMLGKIMDNMIAYESNKYKEQRLISFINDPQNDPFHYQDAYAKQLKKFNFLDAEHLVPTKNLLSGYFASYCIYDYCYNFSEYLSQEQKAALGDALIKLNTSGMYDGYLELLSAYHSMPVVAAGFGFSTARIPVTDGEKPLTEEAQGEALMKFYHEALNSGWSGVLISTWQDVWERRTWNTAFSTVLTKNYLWHNLDCDGQNYGIMAYEPGKEEKICYVDGDISEWSDADIVLSGDEFTLSKRQDEEGMYLMIKGSNLKNRRLFIPIDVTPKSGSTLCSDPVSLEFEREADFLLCLDGEENTRLLVQERYDAMRENFLFEVTGEDPFIDLPERDSDKFVMIGTVMNDNTLVDVTSVSEEEIQKKKPLIVWDAGQLLHGDGNPGHDKYNSLADFCIGKEGVEIRLPWNILNVADPSEMQIADDYYDNYGVVPQKVSAFWIGIGDGNGVISMSRMKMTGVSEKCRWHERLKKSYEVIKSEWKGDKDELVKY